MTTLPLPQNVLPFVRPTAVAQLAAAKLNLLERRAEAQDFDDVLDHDRTIPRARVMLAPETLLPDPAGPEDDAIAPTLVLERPAPWRDYERIGLGPRPRATGRLAKLAVASYRLLGFAILTLIVVVLVGYITSTAFYFLSTSWVRPVAVSATDEKVVALRGELATAQNDRDRLAAELEDTERSIRGQQDFQRAFANAIRTDLHGRQAALSRVRSLASAAARTRSEIRRSNDAYAAEHAAKIGLEYEAGLIDRSTLLGGKHQLAQISTSNLSLAEREADLEGRAAGLAIETRALDALLADASTDDLSYDTLKIKRDYEDSRRALQKATANRQLLQTAIARQDEIIDGLRQAPYLRAVAERATVALVPYGNLDGVRAGTTLHACRVEMLVCREVGHVLEILPGEVTFQHPHRDTTLRGQMIVLRLTEASAAAEDVLFLAGAPLGL